MKRFWFVLIVLFIMNGCSDKEEVNGEMADALNDLERKVSALEQKLTDQQVKIDDQKETIDEQAELIEKQEQRLKQEEDIKKNDHRRLDEKIHRVYDLVSQTTASETAILNSSEVKDGYIELVVTYADMVEDENAPNGFRLEEKNEETVLVDVSTPVYLGSIDPHRMLDIQGFKSKKGAFLEFFKKDGEIVFVQERYLP
ncbi:hypothetical protein E3U55_10550 [Filobacillus milosensis]|uniref:Uncharacterized protein n=1 Tax=Filobacillus milosensis TaxID=94137 RepID=A0A4Y8IGD5_9BACI|nr:hypothetical protein [Filobacillus milosensis]TFB19591.1 hypothetical protein E3U55_10550 [Filobacillus milosensis]